MKKDNALVIGAASFASTGKDTADSAGRQATPKCFSIDEAMCGYADTPENREALRKLFEDARPISKEPIPVNFNYGTP